MGVLTVVLVSRLILIPCLIEIDKSGLVLVSWVNLRLSGRILVFQLDSIVCVKVSIDFI